MFRLRFRTAILIGVLVQCWVASSVADPPDLPPPVNWSHYGQLQSGQDIGLPQGTTTAYALGRSLLKQGDTEAALVYLNRAYRQAPDSWLIADTFAAALNDAGYVHDAVRLYAGLVAAEPDSLSQRRQYALLLAATGRSADALDHVLELQKRGQHDPSLARLHADLLGRLGQVDAAVEVYREAIARYPIFAEEYYLAAAALLEYAQRFGDMLEILREGSALVPTSRSLVRPMLRYLIHRGDLDRALDEASAADSRLKNVGVSQEPEFTIELANLLLGQGRPTEAQEVLSSVLKDGRRSRPIEALKARIHLSMDRFSDAQPILEHAIDQWPDEAELHHLLGSALDMQGDFKAATRHMQTAIDLDPDHGPYRIALMRLYVLHAHENEAGLDAFEERIRIHAHQAAANLDSNDSQGHLLLGYAFRLLDELEIACRHFHLAREINETRLIAGLELNLCLLEIGEDDDAFAVLRELHAEYPDNPDVANNLAYTLAERGEDLDLAEQLVRQALQSDPRNAAYLDSLGWVLYQRGDFDGAFHWLIEAVNSRPDDPVILEHLALTLYRLGKTSEALDILHRALSCGGDTEHLKSLIAEVRHGR